MPESSDAELAASLVFRREAALAEVYRRHWGGMMARASYLTNDRYLAEDVVQEVLWHLWSQPQRYDPRRGSLRNYLLLETRTVAMDRLRSERSRRERENNDRSQALGSGAQELGMAFAEHAASLDLQNALRQLPGRERRAIILAFYVGRSYREVAALMDLSEGTTKSILRRGLQQLRSVLEEPDEESSGD